MPDAFDAALAALNGWLDLPQPVTLPDGIAVSFERTRRYSSEQLAAFEHDRCVRFPDTYRRFLVTVGAGEFFVERGSGVVVHDAQDVPHVMTLAGLPPASPLWLAVSSVRSGEFGGFDLTRPEPNFAVFLPDVPTDVWLDEVDEWQSFSTWVTRLVASRGEMLH